MDPNAKNNDGDTPLHTACRNERSKQVQLLVKNERCNPNEKDSRGNTALHVACRRRYGGIILIALIREYGSTLYVGMTRVINGGQIKRVH